MHQNKKKMQVMQDPTDRCSVLIITPIVVHVLYRERQVIWI